MKKVCAEFFFFFRFYFFFLFFYFFFFFSLLPHFYSFHRFYIENSFFFYIFFCLFSCCYSCCCAAIHPHPEFPIVTLTYSRLLLYPQFFPFLYPPATSNTIHIPNPAKPPPAPSVFSSPSALQLKIYYVLLLQC